MRAQRRFQNRPRHWRNVEFDHENSYALGFHQCLMEVLYCKGPKIEFEIEANSVLTDLRERRENMVLQNGCAVRAKEP